MERREDSTLLYAQSRNTQKVVSLRKHSIGILILLTLAGFILLTGSIIAYYFLPNQDLLLGERKSAGSMNKLIHVEYGGDEYLIPEPFVRKVKRGVLGRIKRIDVRLPWPYWSGDRELIYADSMSDLTGSLFISFEPRQDNLTPEQRFSRIYFRYFAGPPVATPIGARLYVFASDSPYPQAELYLGAQRGRQVLIRCEPTGERLGPSLCESEIPLNSEVLARYRFHRSHMKDWRELDKMAHELINKFRQPGTAG